VFLQGFADVFPQNPKVVADMTALFHIHEPGILHNLRERAKIEDQKPYNFMGTILICVNPLRKVTDPPMDTFVNKPLDPENPHPYAIAEVIYSLLYTCTVQHFSAVLHWAFF
jgi:myosin heavy subunit